ncbi:MAG: glutathione S-transferase family protein [Alphaproteobacteria bacterium]
MKLFGSLYSPFVGRCWLAATAKGGGVDLEAFSGGIKSETYLALNPMGRMPLLVDGEVVLPESAVICEYLDAVLPGPPLMPSGPADRARVQLLCRIADLYLFPASIALLIAPKAAPSEVIAEPLQGTQDALSHLEHFMGDGPYSFGENITLADCTLYGGLALALMVLGRHDVTGRLEGRPKLSKWWGSVRADATLEPAIAQIREAAITYEKQRNL